MKIDFFWGEYFGRMAPHCSSDVCNEAGIDLLACLLMDDGGIPYFETVPWLDHGLSLIQQIRNGGSKQGDWARDCWGAILSVERVRIYSLYDENYFVDMSLDDFEQALLGWKGFIVSG
ncbi:hypothetical protein [Pseudomonas vanderleydeniana]|uniref:Uncharacterized protein n=1 Tax=Pseudomonas vanderleydeniana TaxID=2745495 RepID=A0A9E6TU56_9PSED|nr:hypothetical protein [Pseudomonas vanderleydeniana]QXI29955.1 hypothetical protein HU752_008385 [Pseudomonas vanderleydeniana]